MIFKDLCCGNAGWTKGFLAEGWECEGYDIEPQPLYPGRFIQANILDLTAGDLRGADFVAVSTPCQEFSLWGMRMFFPNPPHPDQGIKLFEHAQEICERSGVPYIMENVRAAQSFVGQAVAKCGPFYLWGNGVPAIFPRECREVQKGLTLGGQNAYRKCLNREQVHEYRKRSTPARYFWSKSEERKAATAKFAEIPFCISNFVAKQFSGHPITCDRGDLPIPSEVLR